MASRAAVQCPAPGAAPREVCLGQGAVRAPAGPRTTMVAGPNPPVIIFNCTHRLLLHVTVAPGDSLACVGLALLHWTDLASFLTSSAAFACPGR